jgi:hypothetical protein
LLSAIERICIFAMKEISLQKEWVIKASLDDVFRVITDFERFPEHFPRVAESVRIRKREGDFLEIDATVKSFVQTFPVKMRTQILPQRGFVSDNESPKFGTSGHEELLLSTHPEGTLIAYSYRVSIHKLWLRLVATPLIRWYSMKYWEKAVIDELRKMFEK